MKTKTPWLKTKPVTIAFAIIALVGGVFFLSGGITGNVISSTKYSFSATSIIGLLLIACAVVLSLYSIKNR